MAKRVAITDAQLLEALTIFRGDRAAAARSLRISLRTLARRLAEHPHLHQAGRVPVSPRPPWLDELWRLEQAVIKCALNARYILNGHTMIAGRRGSRPYPMSMKALYRRIDQIGDITGWRG